MLLLAEKFKLEISKGKVKDAHHKMTGEWVMSIQNKGGWPLQVRGLNFYTLDHNLNAFLRRSGVDVLNRDDADLRSLGEWVGGELDEQAEYSDRYAPPTLEQRLVRSGIPGERRNVMVFNPRYEAAQKEIYQRGVIGKAYEGNRDNPHLVSFIMGYLLSQSDISTHCPVTMTGAVAYVLQNFAPDHVRNDYLHESIRTDGEAKTGGTWATEKHSGSDVPKTQTTAKKCRTTRFA